MSAVPIGIRSTASYLPRRWMSAAEIAAASGIPALVIAEKFGVRGKHIAAGDEHVSHMAAGAGRRAMDRAQVEACDIDGVIYFGSTWKDYPVWQAAPRVAHLLGVRGAFVLELDYVSCATPIALRVARDLMRADPDLNRVLLVGASRESHLVDYDDPGSRFTYNFGDGAAATVLERGLDRNTILGAHSITDGSFSHHVKVPAGGSARPASRETLEGGEHLLRVEDPVTMKKGLDLMTLPNFISTARIACEKSGIDLADIDYLCGIHMKRSIHTALVDGLGLRQDQAAYLDDTGHMSGVDPLFALDRATGGAIAGGDLVLMLAAGTGYTWAAAVIRWGEGGRLQRTDTP